MKIVSIILVVGLVLLGALWLGNLKETSFQEASQSTDTGTDSSTETTHGMYAEKNALVPQEQKPGNSVLIQNVLLAEAGYVVIHEAGEDGPGAVIGNSTLLEAGEFSRVGILLSRGTRDDEILYAMLHGERSGNRAFDSAVDTPIMSALGGPVMASFKIDVDAEPPLEVLP